MRVLLGGKSPERGLSAGILIRALQDVLPHHDDNLRSSAKHWFHNKDNTYPFSFLSICDTLSIDPGSVLKNIRENKSSFVKRIRELR